MDDFNTKQENDVNEKIKDFKLDKVLKNKSSNTIMEPIEKINLINESVKTSKLINSKNNKGSKKYYKYKGFTFYKLVDVYSFLVFDYYNAEKHACKLINDEKFIKWLTDNVNDKQSFLTWVENVLK